MGVVMVVGWIPTELLRFFSFQINLRTSLYIIRFDYLMRLYRQLEHLL